MRNVILFHYCQCGACYSTIISIPKFDLLCLNSSFKFMGFEDDSVMLEEVDRSDSCPKCRGEKLVDDIKLKPLKQKLIKFVNARRPRVTLEDWWLLSEFVDEVEKQ